MLIRKSSVGGLKLRRGVELMIVVTGSTGRVGGLVARRLESAGHFAFLDGVERG